MNQKIKQIEQEYLEFFENNLKKKTNFLSKLKIQNIRNKEVINLNSNIEYLIKNDYLYLVYNSIALQKKFENSKYTGVFITNTLRTEFHEFKQEKNGKIIYNTKFEIGNNINLGYKILNNFFKGLYKDFKVNNLFIKVEYIKVIEPHKSFTTHLHAMIFVPTEYLKDFKKHYERKVINNKFLGSYIFEIIDNISRSASYILKYAQKNFSVEDNKFKIYYGWKLKNKIRAYTFTRQFINRDMFNKLSFHISKDFIFDKDSINVFGVNNFYELVHKFTKFNQEIFDIKTGEIKSKSKEHDEDDIFVVKILKERQLIDNCGNHKIVEIEKALYTQNIKNIQYELEKYNLLNDFNYYLINQLSMNYLQLNPIVYIFYLSNFLETLKNKTRYQYKINNYQIYKKHHEVARYDEVYNKRDWQIVKN